MSDVDRRKEGILDFILIAGGDGEIGEHVAGLSAHVCAVVLKEAVADKIAEFGGGDGSGIGLGTERVGIGGVKTLQRIVAGLAGVGFAAADFVAPVFAGGKIPAGAGAENLLTVTLIEARRREDRLSGNAGVAGVIANGEAELVVVAEGVAEISGKRAIYKIVVWSLAVRLHIGCGSGIVELAEQTAELQRRRVLWRNCRPRQRR